MNNDIKQWIEQRKSTPCHRQIIHICGNEKWALRNTEQLLSGCSDLLWVGNSYSKNIKTTSNKNYRQVLGQEYDYLVYNAYSGLRANALMALAGTIKQGGLLILISPEEEEWKQFQDPEIEEKTSSFFQSECLPSHFVMWLVKNLSSDTNVVRWSERSLNGKNKLRTIQGNSRPPPYKSHSQQLAVEAIKNLALKKQKYPLVITADRGRGKSSSLGIAAAQLMSSVNLQIGITAPNFRSCDTSFKMASELIDHVAVNSSEFKFKQASFKFYPFDQLILDTPNLDLLFIDEAAAIPSSVLQQLQTLYKKCVFSTTIHGYEGTGRGFEIRFKPYLNKHAPKWRHIELAEPIRWAENDPIEQFFFKTMMFNPPTFLNDSQQSLSHGIHTVKARELLKYPRILYECFNLLIN